MGRLRTGLGSMSLFYFKITESHIDEIEDKFFAVVRKVGNIFQPLQGANAGEIDHLK